MAIYNERVHRPNAIARMCPTLWANYQASCARTKAAEQSDAYAIVTVHGESATVFNVVDDEQNVLASFNTLAGYTRRDAEQFVVDSMKHDEQTCSDIDAVLGGRR